MQLFQDEPTWSAWAERWTAEIARRANILRLWFSPVYGGTGCGAVNFIRGARPLQVVYSVVFCVGLFRFLRREDARVIGVFAVGFAAYVLFVVPIAFHWYLMPWLGVVALLFAFGVDGIRGEGRHRLRKLAAAFLAVGYLALYAFALTRTFPAERHIQIGIENACRAAVGRWLDEHVAAEDWVACECLGYFGYYSHRAILDFPGLCSPRSVAALRQMPEGERTLAALVSHERPEWLALRPKELERLREEYPEAASLYVEAAPFHADPERVKKLGECLWLDGPGLTIDAEFLVLRRQDVQPKNPEPR